MYKLVRSFWSLGISRDGNGALPALFSKIRWSMYEIEIDSDFECLKRLVKAYYSPEIASTFREQHLLRDFCFFSEGEQVWRTLVRSSCSDAQKKDEASSNGEYFFFQFYEWTRIVVVQRNFYQRGAKMVDRTYNKRLLQFFWALEILSMENLSEENKPKTWKKWVWISTRKMHFPSFFSLACHFCCLRKNYKFLFRRPTVLQIEKTSNNTFMENFEPQLLEKNQLKLRYW